MYSLFYFWCFGYFILLAMPLSGYQVLNDISSYGWLDQYSLNTRHSFVGDEACVPTSSVNGLTYLQNVSPEVFGTHLTGATYYDWENMADYFITTMGTTVASGTYYDQFVYALNAYVTQTQGYSQVQFSGMFPNDNWGTPYTKPNYIASGKPDIPFLTNAIAGGSAVLTSIEYFGGGGHEILVNGIEWNPVTNTGIVYFIDPLDPSQNYSPETPLGPVKQTAGTLSLDNEGNLVLQYNQYEGSLPYEVDYEIVNAHLYGALSVGGGAFIPFSHLLKKGNNFAIAKGFDNLDPSTTSLFSILAVFNTLSDDQLQEAFQKLDPSIFSSILLSEQDLTLRIRKLINQNLMNYFDPCQRPDCGLRIWAMPFTENIHRQKQHSHDGYRSLYNGMISGIDYFLSDNALLGAGFNYSKTQLKWDRVNAEGDYRSWGGVLYGIYQCTDEMVDCTLAYLHHHVKAKRLFSAASSIPFISPLDNTFSHHNSSESYLIHVGSKGPLCNCTYDLNKFTFWKFANLDYVTALQPKFTESGGVLAYTVQKNHELLFEPEIGVGCSTSFNTSISYNAYIDASLSYCQQIRLGGRKTTACFVGNPNTSFRVHGLYPKEGLFLPTFTIGLKSLDACHCFNVQLNYQGAFGSHLSANQITLELNAVW